MKISYLSRYDKIKGFDTNPLRGTPVDQLPSALGWSGPIPAQSIRMQEYAIEQLRVHGKVTKQSETTIRLTYTRTG